MHCPFCNKWLDQDETVCPHCGEQNPLSPTAPPDEYVKVLARLHNQRLLEELLQYTPSAERLWTHPLWFMPLGWVLGGVTFGFFGIREVLNVGHGSHSRVFGLLLLALSILGIAAGLPRLIRVMKSSLVRLPATVLRKRRGFTLLTRIRFVTLRTEGNPEREYVVEAEVFGEVEKGDGGIAYLRDGLLLDFKRTYRRS